MVFFVSLVTLLTILFLFFFFSTYTRPHITDKQEEFIRRVLEIPLEERKCRDLITLDTIHLYCGGVQSRRLKLGGWRSSPVGVSKLSPFALLVIPVSYSNNLYIVEMESAKQRIQIGRAHV